MSTPQDNTTQEPEVLQARAVLKKEATLAIDGYSVHTHPGGVVDIHLDVSPDVSEKSQFHLHPNCRNRSLNMLECMLGFLNAGGHWMELEEMVEAIRKLPEIANEKYTTIDAACNPEWVSYIKRNSDDVLFELHHGTIAFELSEEDVEMMLEDIQETRGIFD